MNELSDTLQQIPPAALIPLIAAVVIGILLWAAGRRVLRTSFAGLGLLGGFTIGWLVGGWLNLGVPAWAVGLVLGVVLAVVAVILYRTAVAATMAIILAVASPMAVVALHEWQGNPVFIESNDPEGDEAIGPNEPDAEPEGAPEPDEFDVWLNLQGENLARDHAGELVPEEYREQLEQLRSYGEQLLEACREAWDTVEPSIRPTLIGAAVSGAILGLILGGLLPGFSASIITAFGGSLLWLAAVRVLIERVGWGDLGGTLPSTGRGWLIVWLAAAVLGMGIQWTVGAKKADK